jgi:hypothetical protein
MTVPHKGKNWRLAKSLIAMEAEADRLAPNRNRASDGSIGDQSHQARQSDHNPDGDKTVDALDLTHSPERGWDTHARARQVARNVVNGIERRIKYIISLGEIFSKKGGRWAWRPYTGPNKHVTHAHYSVEDAYQDDTSPWFASVVPFPTKPVPPPYIPPVPDEEDDMSHAILRCEGKGVMHIVAGCINTLETAEVPLVEKSYEQQGIKVYKATISQRRWAQLERQMD